MQADRSPASQQERGGTEGSPTSAFSHERPWLRHHQKQADPRQRAGTTPNGAGSRSPWANPGVPVRQRATAGRRSVAAEGHRPPGCDSRPQQPGDPPRMRMIDAEHNSPAHHTSAPAGWPGGDASPRAEDHRRCLLTGGSTAHLQAGGQAASEQFRQQYCADPRPL